MSRVRTVAAIAALVGSGAALQSILDAVMVEYRYRQRTSNDAPTQILAAGEVARVDWKFAALLDRSDDGNNVVSVCIGDGDTELRAQMRPDDAREIAGKMIQAADLCDSHGVWQDQP